jgi:hypothetical protein
MRVELHRVGDIQQRMMSEQVSDWEQTAPEMGPSTHRLGPVRWIRHPPR